LAEGYRRRRRGSGLERNEFGAKILSLQWARVPWPQLFDLAQRKALKAVA
jgi:hypothetical protein